MNCQIGSPNTIVPWQLWHQIKLFAEMLKFPENNFFKEKNFEEKKIVKESKEYPLGCVGP